MNETPAERFARLVDAARAKAAASQSAVQLTHQLTNGETQNVIRPDERTITNSSNGHSNPIPAIPTTSANNSASNRNSTTTAIEAAKQRLAEFAASRALPATTTITNSTTDSAVLLEQASKQRKSIPTGANTISSIPSNTLTNNLSADFQGIGRNGESISYNEKQLEFIQAAGTGESCILIGAAGTGKTTCMTGTVKNLIQSGIAGILQSDGHTYLPSTGVPGIVICAYTRRATANIRRQMPEDLKGNCITIHKLLEYQPVYESVIDPTTGDEISKMYFAPTRNSSNPLSPSIRTIIIEESSMVAVDLYQEIINACPHKPQIIFLGDIQQLPPVFGAAILGYKMLELKTVELTEVYRQALESPIIKLAHRILSGRAIPSAEYPEWKTENKLTLHPWKKKLTADNGVLTAAAFFKAAETAGAYDPNEDQILLPFNKSFGTIELNKHVAQHLARKRQAIVYEIQAGFNLHYFSVGDKVLVDREDAIIVDISLNADYTGKSVQKHSQHLDYWGFNPKAAEEAARTLLADTKENTEAADFFLDSYTSSDSEDRVRKSSHVITVELYDSGITRKIDKAADVNNMLLAYALTVHKSQGSEWRKVFLVLHQSHATMLQRELLYTAVTRAKEELYVICEPESFTAGIVNQKIKGNTLAEKAEFFKGKLDMNGGY